MPILITCHCGKKFYAIDEARGKAVRCPGCSKVLRVPADPPRAAAKPAARPRPAAGAAAKGVHVFLIRCSRCKRTLKVRGVVGGPPVKCPCGNMAEMKPVAPASKSAIIAARPKGPPCPICQRPTELGSGVCLECGANIAIAQQLRGVSPQQEEARMKRRVQIALGVAVVVALVLFLMTRR